MVSYLNKGTRDTVENSQDQSRIRRNQIGETTAVEESMSARYKGPKRGKQGPLSAGKDGIGRGMCFDLLKAGGGRLCGGGGGLPVAVGVVAGYCYIC